MSSSGEKWHLLPWRNLVAYTPSQPLPPRAALSSAATLFSASLLTFLACASSRSFCFATAAARSALVRFFAFLRFLRGGPGSSSGGSAYLLFGLLTRLFLSVRPCLLPICAARQRTKSEDAQLPSSRDRAPGVVPLARHFQRRSGTGTPFGGLAQPADWQLNPRARGWYTKYRSTRLTVLPRYAAPRASLRRCYAAAAAPRHPTIVGNPQSPKGVAAMALSVPPRWVVGVVRPFAPPRRVTAACCWL